MASIDVIKVFHKDDIRRFRVTEKMRRSLSALRYKIEFLYGPSLAQSEWRLCWTDEDADLVTIASDEDLQLAFETVSGANFHILRLQVSQTSRPTTRPTTPVAHGDDKETVVVHPAHVHPLKLSGDPRPWLCDGEDRVGGCRHGGVSRFGVDRYHCIAGCDYDLCHKCVEDRTRDEDTETFQHALHPHPLVASKRINVWECDGTNRKGGCRNGRDHGAARYRCAIGCDYDLCQGCINDPSAEMKPVEEKKEDSRTAPGLPSSHANLEGLIGNVMDMLRPFGIDVSVERPDGSRCTGFGRGGRCGSRKGQGRCQRRGKNKKNEDKVEKEETKPTSKSEVPLEEDQPVEKADAGNQAQENTVEEDFVKVGPYYQDPETKPQPENDAQEAKETRPHSRWEKEIGLLRDMGIKIDYKVLEEKLVHHSGLISAVLSEIFNNPQLQ